MEDDGITMVYGMMTLDGYLAILNVLKSLNTNKKEIIPDYEGIVESVSDGLGFIKGAFASREFLRKCLEYDISDERIGEFEDFLGGRKNKLSGLDEEILKIDSLYKSLKFLN